MYNINVNTGIDAMVFSARAFLFFLMAVFCLLNDFSGWPLLLFYCVNLLGLNLLKRNLDWDDSLYLNQYFLDALACIFSIFLFDANVFLVLCCFFIIFSRYQGGSTFGSLVTVFFILCFSAGTWLSFNGGGLSITLDFVISFIFMVFSLHLGSLLSSLYSEKNAAIESLEIRMKNKDRLLSTLAHEIRTPLTMVVSSSDILMEEIEPNVNETQFGFLSAIHDSALRLVGIVEDILAQIKAEKSLLKINAGPMDIRKLVKQVVANMSPILSKKEQYIRCSYPKLLTSALGDEKWVHQALVNLVHNASKYIGFGGNILINVKENEQYFVVSVIDDGLGIDDMNKTNIFSEASVDDNYRSYEGGAGIGLSIVKHIIEQHGGKLYVGTVPGVGTTLSFTLPKSTES
jgi:signal transduction histidine kinase